MFIKYIYVYVMGAVMGSCWYQWDESFHNDFCWYNSVHILLKMSVFLEKCSILGLFAKSYQGVCPWVRFIIHLLGNVYNVQDRCSAVVVRWCIMCADLVLVWVSVHLHRLCSMGSGVHWSWGILYASGCGLGCVLGGKSGFLVCFQYFPWVPVWSWVKSPGWHQGWSD